MSTPAHARVAAMLGAGAGDGLVTVLPRYDGYSIVNLTATLMRALGGFVRHPPLAPGLLGPALFRGVERVVLLVVDALGYRHLLRHLEAGKMPAVARLVERAQAGAGAFFPLTSVFPSTTVAALTALLTGAPPCESGLLGYTQYLDELNDVVEMIGLMPLGSLKPVSPVPPRLLAAPSAAQVLSAAGVDCVAVSPGAFRHSFLTAYHYRGATYTGYQSLADMAALAAWAAGQASGPAWVTAYWPGLDVVAHQYGPGSPEAAAEAAAVDEAAGRLAAALAAGPAAGRTLLVLAADHGQVDLDDPMLLRQQGQLLAHLRGTPAGERRALYLRPLYGEEEWVAQWARVWGGRVVPAAEAWSRGWFGGPPGRPGFRERVGDLIVLPPGRQQWYYALDPFTTVAWRGAHGGLTAEEMLVPALFVRL